MLPRDGSRRRVQALALVPLLTALVACSPGCAGPKEPSPADAAQAADAASTAEVPTPVRIIVPYRARHATHGSRPVELDKALAGLLSRVPEPSNRLFDRLEDSDRSNLSPDGALRVIAEPDPGPGVHFKIYRTATQRALTTFPTLFAKAPHVAEVGAPLPMPARFSAGSRFILVCATWPTMDPYPTHDCRLVDAVRATIERADELPWTSPDERYRVLNKSVPARIVELETGRRVERPEAFVVDLGNHLAVFWGRPLEIASLDGRAPPAPPPPEIEDCKLTPDEGGCFAFLDRELIRYDLRTRAIVRLGTPAFDRCELASLRTARAVVALRCGVWIELLRLDTQAWLHVRAGRDALLAFRDDGAFDGDTGLAATLDVELGGERRPLLALGARLHWPGLIDEYLSGQAPNPATTGLSPRAPLLEVEDAGAR